jgi:hypothetical protein
VTLLGAGKILITALAGTLAGEAIWAFFVGAFRRSPITQSEDSASISETNQIHEEHRGK